MRLSKYELETIINFNQAEDTAYIYTCSISWMNHMEKVLGVKPTKKYSYAREYECPKTWIKKPRKPRILSENQRQKLVERMSQITNLSEKTPYTVGKTGKEIVR
jgi:hypothetical protein